MVDMFYRIDSLLVFYRTKKAEPATEQAPEIQEPVNEEK